MKPTLQAEMPDEGNFVSEAASIAAGEWRWVAQSLHDSIANLGYPVGMGMAPNPASTERAAKLICEYIACQIEASDTPKDGETGR
jgi:enhancing lycopene biosynthesis protein 2